MAVSSRSNGVGYVIPPHTVGDFDIKRDVNRCKNEGCGDRWVPDGAVLRCPRDVLGKRTCQLGRQWDKVEADHKRKIAEAVAAARYNVPETAGSL